jgi:hypothetical protein
LPVLAQTPVVSSPDLAAFRAHYAELLGDVAARRDELGVRAVAAHWPHVGNAYGGLLVVGQALKGWAVDWSPAELATAEGRERILDDAAAVHAELDEPMSWVPSNKRVHISSFWNFMERIADAANPGPEPWFARVAWWNLHPLAPTDPEGNPWGALREAQQRMAGPLLLDVVEALDAKKIALVPGRLRLPTAEPAGLTELPDAWPILAAGRLHGRSWIVGEHPGWASRRHFGPTVYAPLVAERLRYSRATHNAAAAARATSGRYARSARP